VKTGDDLNWDIVKALMEQESMAISHVARVRERRDRYEGNAVAWAEVNLELRWWEHIQKILFANLEGKTVPPS
jgi:hypothetical protein